MTAGKRNFVRFRELTLENYGPFLGRNTLTFGRRTIIVGEPGTGKTMIAKALEYLEPTPAIDIGRAGPSIPFHVVTSGNRNLIQEYREIIFLGSEYTSVQTGTPPLPFSKFVNQNQLRMVTKRAQDIFIALLFYKPAKRRVHGGMDPQFMAAGERLCLRYAFAFALRKVLRLDLPVVFDSPYGLLDAELRQGLVQLLIEQPYQQILLGVQKEFTKEDRPTYVLERKEDYSRIRKITPE